MANLSDYWTIASVPGGGGGGDMLLDTVQTITAAKTFNAGTLLLDDSDSIFNLTLTSTSTITTSNKTLTFDVNNANRTLTLSGDATISGTNTGDNAGVTSVTGGTGIASTGGNTPSLSLTVDELAEKTGAVVGTDRLVGTTGTTNWAETISGIPLSIFNNDLSIPASSITAGNLISTVLPYATAVGTASDFKIPFLNATGTTSGNFGLLFENGAGAFTYNPSTNVVTATTFSGALSGNATSASTAATLSATLAATLGGTGTGTYATGDILYASATNTLSKLSAGTNTHVLTLTGGVPTWAAPTGGGGGGIPSGGAANNVLEWASDGVAAWVATTGTGNVVRAISPTFTGTLSAGVITATGDITGNTSSDIRLKENIKLIGSPLDKVMALSGNSFNFIDQPLTGTQYGFMAHEMEKVLPELVHEGGDGFKKIRNGGFEVEALLVEAIKELKTEVDALRAEVRELKKGGV